MKRILLFQMLLLSTISSYCQTTFNDIKPLLIEYCATCHRVGGGAPFDILDYETASIWQSAILHEVYEGYMPPWQADTSYMHFIGEREITEEAKILVKEIFLELCLENFFAVFAPANIPHAIPIKTSGASYTK